MLQNSSENREQKQTFHLNFVIYFTLQAV